MSPTSSVNSAAVLILQQANSSSTSFSKAPSPGEALTAAANGATTPGLSGLSKTQARAKATEALFSANVPDVHQMKVHLMERLGDMFGVKVEDYESPSAFGSAIRDIIDGIKRQPGGDLVLSEIEEKLGLDKLGISLDQLVNAVVDPEGSDAEKLEAALRKQAGAPEKGEDDKRTGVGGPLLLTLDESGLYTF